MKKITLQELKSELGKYNKFPDNEIENIRVVYVKPFRTKIEQRKKLNAIIETYSRYVKEIKEKYLIAKKKGKRPMYRGLSVSETKIKRIEAYIKALKYVRQEL